MKRIIIACVSLLLLVLLVFLAFPKKQVNKNEKVRIAEVTHSIFYAPQYVAISRVFVKMKE